ncbi:MAG: OmpA family protein [Clostridia bacterium]
MARKRNVRRSGGKADGGAAWISYSDMMAALLLVFVLVLCYSVYQYFLMLETKTAELDAKSSLLTTQEQQLTTQQTTLVTQQSTLDEQTAALEQQKLDLAAKQAELLKKQNELTGALTAISEKDSLLSNQTLTLEEQQKIILAAQAALTQKENELIAAKKELDEKQNALASATILLGEQQDAMSNQQRKLDDLVGVRTKIIRDLSISLTNANLKVAVDKNTGDIMLESTVFFDVAKSNLKDSGYQLLEEFMPIYLGVLLSDEYADYLGEIIIEGHTDTQGTYLMNLELSQDRALSVAAYCLQMRSLTEPQLEKLRSILTAKGRSYSNPIYREDGSVDMNASRRVEFKFRMKDSEMIDEMRSILANGDS